jgi:iron(III) transport system permease protein
MDWQNYAALFDMRHLTLGTNSFVLAIGATCLCLVVGIPLAFFIQRTNLWGRAIFGTVYIIPILIPPYIHAIVWTHLNPSISKLVGLDIHSLWGGILVLTLSYFPFITLMTSSGLKSIDRNVEEASLLSHGRWHTVKGITLPIITPHVLSGAIFVFIFSIVDFAVPDILRVKVYPVEIFVQFSAFFDEGAATILSVPLITITLFMIVLQKWHMKNRSYVQISGGYSRTARYNLGWLNIPSLGFCFMILGLSVGLPLAVLLKTAGPFSNYVRALSTSWDQISYSLVLAGSGAMICLLLAFSLSYLFQRTQIRMKTILELASFVPFAIPAITLGIGLIRVWNRPLADLIYGSSLIIIFGYIARFIPFSVVALSSGFKQASPRLEEVAHLTSPHWARVVRRIVIPLLRPSLITGFFIVFILSFGELGTTLLVIPPGKETIPIKIYNLMHYGAEQIVAALCVSLVAIVLAFSALFLILHKKLTAGIAG